MVSVSSTVFVIFQVYTSGIRSTGIQQFVLLSSLDPGQGHVLELQCSTIKIVSIEPFSDHLRLQKLIK